MRTRSSSAKKRGQAESTKKERGQAASVQKNRGQEESTQKERGQATSAQKKKQKTTEMSKEEGLELFRAMCQVVQQTDAAAEAAHKQLQEKGCKK